MNKIILIGLGMVCLSSSFIAVAKELTQEKSVPVQSTKLRTQKTKPGKVLDPAVEKKIKGLLSQINIQELENIVSKVSQKYQTQLSYPSDKDSFLTALQSAQADIVSTYQKKFKL